jgi:hypothetical protein
MNLWHSLLQLEDRPQFDVGTERAVCARVYKHSAILSGIVLLTDVLALILAVVWLILFPSSSMPTIFVIHLSIQTFVTGGIFAILAKEYHTLVKGGPTVQLKWLDEPPPSQDEL